MATADQLGSAFVDLSYRGFDSLKSGMSQVKSITKEVGESFDKMASKATTAFASLSGTLLATTRAASPQLFNTFTGSLSALSAVVGIKLMPLLMDFTRWIVDTGKWLASFDDKTWENIRTWVKWGIAITGSIVALNTLKSVFGGLASTMIKFAIANPLVTAFGAVIVLIGAAIMSMKDLDEHLDQTIKKAARLKKGDINEGDMTDETNRINRIADPKERARQAQVLIDAETKRKDDALKHYNRTDMFGDVDTLRMGWETIKGKIGLNSETTDLKKIQDSAGSNIGVATQIRDAALKDQSIKVKADPTKNTGNELFQALSGLGQNQKAISVGGVGDIWKSIQQSQNEDPQLKIMTLMLGGIDNLNKETQKTNTLIQEQNRSIELPNVGGK